MPCPCGTAQHRGILPGRCCLPSLSLLQAAAEPGARSRMQRMFQTAQTKAKPTRTVADDASADELLEGILGNLDSVGPSK